MQSAEIVLRLHRLRPLHPPPSKVLAEFYIDSTPPRYYWIPGVRH